MFKGPYIYFNFKMEGKWAAMEHIGENSMSELLEKMSAPIARINAGDVVKGRIISVTKDEIFVNIGYMADGIITRDEIGEDYNVNLKDSFKEGEEIEVYILKVNDGDGNVALSKKRADSLKVWDELEEALNKGLKLNVVVKEAVNGGVITYIKGARAFIPASHVSTSHVADLKTLIGKSLEVKLIELDKEKRRIVLSRKEVEKAEKEEKRESLWAGLQKGERRKGIISRLAKFGAFVDLGGVDGLIHLSDLSWKRINDPSEVVKVGDEVEVYVLDFDKDKGRISLGLKEVSEDPWNNITERYNVNSVISGKVIKFINIGAFVELEAGVEGLVHISEISEERIAKPSDKLNIGDVVKVKVLEVKEKEKRISLSIKEAIEKPVEDYSQYNDDDNVPSLGDLFKNKLEDLKFQE